MNNYYIPTQISAAQPLTPIVKEVLGNRVNSTKITIVSIAYKYELT
ncbi:hypothetical protein [Chamaesiphon sp. OTE_20_metabat_361]|nr:hypothetical protein [Chamaesiphon sp. OTE_20_metabat_361]